MRLLSSVLVVLSFPPFSIGSSYGQTLVGRVLVPGDSAGVEGVNLILLDTLGQALLRVESDSSGTFRRSVPGRGDYEIVASRLGLSTSRVPIRAFEKEMVEVELRMAEEAIALDPLVVVARRRIREGTPDGFYDRMELMKRRGVRWFFTRTEIECREQIDLPALLSQVPGVFIQPRRPSRGVVAPDLPDRQARNASISSTDWGLWGPSLRAPSAVIR